MRRLIFPTNLKRKHTPHAQSLVEFALTLPVLLLLVFGIIEFGRILQAWLALENGARFAIRYAVTGNYNPTYCDEAAAALSGKFSPRQVMGESYTTSGTIDFATADASSGVYDCNVSAAWVNAQSWHRTDKTNEEMELLNSVVIDWARLPSIREAALSGAMGLAFDPDEPVTGNYLSFLDTAYDVGSVFGQTYRGSPQLPGYFGFTLCSNRVNEFTGDSFSFNNNVEYYSPNDPATLDDYRFPTFCSLVDASSNFVRHVDDAGGPGNRVCVI
ncbi:pilus assembly protein, partial [bacterium]|nr:pilus assembly protein [bacterium]